MGMRRVQERTRAVVARFLREEAGATAIEYGVIAALMAVAILGALSSISDALTGLYEDVDAGLDS